MTKQILALSQVNLGQQNDMSQESQKQQNTISNLAPQVVDSTNKVGTLGTEMAETQKKGENFQSQVPHLVEQTVANDPGKLDEIANKTNEGLSQSKEPVIPTNPNPSGNDSGKDIANLTRMDVIQKDDKPGGGNRISSWFASKLSGVKAGVVRLNAKILRGL